MSGFTQIIPWATTQPQWVMLVIFTDSTDQSDTLYLGYDAGASQYFYPQDSIFGEYKIPFDSSFNAFWGYAFWPPIIDSTIHKVSIVKQFQERSEIGPE